MTNNLKLFNHFLFQNSLAKLPGPVSVRNGLIYTHKLNYYLLLR
jgi:hypothetical protein